MNYRVQSIGWFSALKTAILSITELKIQIEGHTDNRGRKEANKKLSLDRAFKVREYLLNKGIAGDRIKFKGYGDTRPVVTNDNEENRKLNRRVEYKILED